MDYVIYSVVVAAKGVSTHVTLFAGPQAEHDARMFLINMGMTEPAQTAQIFGSCCQMRSFETNVLPQL